MSNFECNNFDLNIVCSHSSDLSVIYTPSQPVVGAAATTIYHACSNSQMDNLLINWLPPAKLFLLLHLMFSLYPCTHCWNRSYWHTDMVIFFFTMFVTFSTADMLYSCFLSSLMGQIGMEWYWSKTAFSSLLSDL